MPQIAEEADGPGEVDLLHGVGLLEQQQRKEGRRDEDDGGEEEGRATTVRPLWKTRRRASRESPRGRRGNDPFV